MGGLTWWSGGVQWNCRVCMQARFIFLQAETVSLGIWLVEEICLH